MNGMKSKICILALIFLNSWVFSQKEASNWFFGVNAGLNFNSSVPINTSGSELISNEGCAAISDKNGNLLFYSDGNTIWNRNHEILLNGENLLGHHSSTQAALIVPKPGSRTIYYVFTVDKPNYYLTEEDPISGINYSIVDMNLDSGLGGVINSEKNKHLVTYDPSDAIQNEFKCSEKITAVLHADGSSYWVITQFVDKFYAFKIDYNGLQSVPVISSTSQVINPAIDDEGINKSAIGYIKASPNGEKIAIAHSSTTPGSPRTGTKKSGKVFLYDFNASNGKVTNAKSLISSEYPYGVEFSPKSNKLYITSSIFNRDDILEKSNLYQFNLESGDVKSTKKTIQSSSAIAGGLQLAIDGRIYRATNSRNLSVIKAPGESGPSCNYAPNSVQLDEKSTLGLPPFIQSFFLFTFNYEYQCYGDTTNFYITTDEPFDSVLWNFGDGNISTLEEPQHIYNQSGTYEVSLTKYIGNEPSDKILKPITIFAIPKITMDTYDLIQCDTQDTNKNDGLSIFNLELAIDYLTSENKEDIDVYFYTKESNAKNDINNFNSINPIYSNILRDEIVFAKILKKGSDCFSIAKIRLIANSPSDVILPDYYSCEQSNNEAEFDLESQRLLLINSMNLPSSATITFHESHSNAALDISPLSNTIISNEKMIYAKVRVGGICFGIGTLNLLIYDFPEIMETEEISNCFNAFPLVLSSGIPTNNISNFHFDWGNGNTNHELEVLEAGNYQVTITDSNTLCTKIRQVKVFEIPESQISDINIDEQQFGFNATIIMSDNALLNDNYNFALDKIDGPYQESNIFANIEPGNHFVYVKNEHNCNIVEKEFFILGYPKFLTPNNDGQNDTWQIMGYDKNSFKASDITIFDRYGKLIAILDPLSTGWDGLYKGKILTTNEFWFKISLTDLKGETNVTRGHFSLIRR